MIHPHAIKAAKALASQMGMPETAVTIEPGPLSGLLVMVVPAGSSAPRVWCGYVVETRQKP